MQTEMQTALILIRLFLFRPLGMLHTKYQNLMPLFETNIFNVFSINMKHMTSWAAPFLAPVPKFVQT